MRDAGHDLLLVAGGVGINPLYSIINNMADLCVKGGNPEKFRDTRVLLLYSARSEEELIFKVYHLFVHILDL